MRPALKHTANKKDPYQSAVALYSSARFAEALATLKPMLQSNPVAVKPNRAAAYNLAAACSLSLNHTTDAETYWRRAIQERPGYAEAYNNLGVLLKQLKRWPEAETACRQALECQPSYTEAHNTLGSLLYDLERLDEAEAACREALALNPGHVDAQYNLGVILYGQKRLPEAETVFSQLLAIQPNHPAAWNNLGNVLYDLKRLPDAEAAYTKALAISPGLAQAHYSLSVLLKGDNRLPESEAACRRALTLRPDYVEAHYHLGTLCYSLNRLPEAESAYRHASTLKPDNADWCYKLAVVQHALKRFEEAEASYRRTLQIDATHTRALNNLGTVLIEFNQLSEAETCYRDALNLRPDFTEAFNNLGVLLKTLDRLPEAETACRQALAIRPDYAEAHNNLGIVLHDLKRFSESESAYRQALDARPDYADAYYNLGILFKEIKQPSESEAAFRQALAIQPDLTKALNNLGVLLQELDRLHDAVDVYEQAITLNSNYQQAHNNLGIVLKELDRLPEAETHYRQALTISPNYADAKFNLAALTLGTGRFAEGWPLYEARYDEKMESRSSIPPNVRCPQWQGEPLHGKSLLVWFEQGHGDMIQFGRYLALLKAQGAAHITLACAPALQRLLGSVHGVDAVITNEAALAPREPDYWTFLLSAPLHLGTTVESIPDAVYLEPDAQLVEKWRQRLAPLTGRKVGLVWKGSVIHANDRHRSLPSLAALAPLWSLPGLSFVSLQKGQGEDEALAAPANQPILHLGSEIQDFADSAAIIAQLDLVICVDTAIAHLAGALGKPCWVLLPKTGTDWRWLRDRTDSPWYPHSMRLFRQAVMGDWRDAIEQIGHACAHEFPASTPVAADPGRYQTAVALYSSGRFADALATLQPLLASPAAANLAAAYNVAAACSFSLKQMQDAEMYWRRAIQEKPDFASAYNNLSALLKELKRLPEAEAACRQALAISPGYADAHNSLGSLLYDLKRLPEAEAACRQALAINPNYTDAHYNLGVVLHEMKRLKEAEASYWRVLAIQPDQIRALNNLGVLLSELDRLHEAAEVCEHALILSPNYSHAHNSLGVVLKDLDRLPEAETHYRQALTISPDYADAKFNLASLMLSTGRFAEGWALYEARYDESRVRRSSFAPNVRCPQWQGEPLQGKSLLVWFEQGHGDMIQFGRYLALLKAQGAAHITLACAPALQRLLGSVHGVDAVITNEAALAPREPDYWTFLLSAPLHLGTTVESIPDAVYLEPDAQLVEKWRQRLAPLTGRKVGLVWKGSVIHANDRHRSLPSLAALAPLWSLPGLSFVSLQKGQGEDEALAAPANQPILHLGSEIQDFADSAAIIAQLDLVICVDTAIAHLAGALGKPCWVLLPKTGTDWRWLRDRTDSPWYPHSMRLFRQAVMGDWHDAIEQVRQAMSA